MILEDVIKLLFGGLPLSAGAIMDLLGTIRIGGLLYPTYNFFVIGVGRARRGRRCGGSSTAPSSA